MKNRRLDFKTDILPFIIATVGEFTALYFWLYYLDADKFIWANIILWLGFLVERAAVYLWMQYVYRKDQIEYEKPKISKVIIGILAITLSEILIWIFWLNLADGNIAPVASSFLMDFFLAGIVLMILMTIEHSVEMAGLRGQSPLTYVTNSSTILFTFMEVAGAMGWLYFVRTDRPLIGALCLLAGLSIEHVLQGSDLRPKKGDELNPVQ